jgi:hypothetical protein
VFVCHVFDVCFAQAKQTYKITSNSQFFASIIQGKWERKIFTGSGNPNQTLPENTDWWIYDKCSNQNVPPGDPSWTEGENAIPCDIRCQLFTQNDNNNLATNGSGGRINDCGAQWGYSCVKAIEPDFPVYIQVAAGHYHSIALSDDNNLKIWGSYVKVDENGEPLTEETSFTNTDPIPVFLPNSEIFQDKWDLGPAGGVTGCADTCPDGNGCTENYDHLKYKVFTTADKTIYSSASIFAIDGGPDYSIMARKDGDRHRLVVWGNSEMVTAVSGVTYSGLTAFYGKNYGKQLFMNGLCPIAEKLQTEIMAFKTNYLDDNVLNKQAESLSNLIDKIGR